MSMFIALVLQENYFAASLSNTMSPASKSKSKSKEKSATKPAKEQKGNGGSKPSSSSTTGNANTASTTYNPISGTFHSLETSPIDDITEEHLSSPHGTVSEYDTMSNNGSCSGESEDNNKDKIPNSTPPRDAVPSDRREKIRLKNEKKHQRQRERRAQELHDRCCGYLMSRKLESLSQQLVNMGFSSERATLALILNEGRVEDSVSWLFDGNEEFCHDRDRDKSRDCLKIDISEELSRVGELEAKYKCSKQEVERAIVGSEGDLAKAEESLRVQKLESVSKSELNSELNNESKPQPQEKGNAVVIAQRRSERDLNYSRSDPSLQPFKPNQNPSPNLNPNVLVSRTDKRWSSAMPNQPAVAKNEAFRTTSGEKMNHHIGLREPVIMMQRPQPGRSSTGPNLSLGLTGFYPSDPSRVESLRSNMKLLHSQRLVGVLGPESQTSEPFYHHSSVTPNVHNSRHRSHSLAAPPSLGLFSSWRSGGSFGPTSQIDWNSGGSMHDLDYTAIDWTLDTSLTSKSNGLLLGLSSLLRNEPSPAADPPMSRFMGWQDGGVVPETGPYEWTSPFTGRDIFRLPRQFVTSPSP